MTMQILTEHKQSRPKRSPDELNADVRSRRGQRGGPMGAAPLPCVTKAGRPHERPEQDGGDEQPGGSLKRSDEALPA